MVSVNTRYGELPKLCSKRHHSTAAHIQVDIGWYLEAVTPIIYNIV